MGDSAGVCWDASRLQLQSVILNPEDSNELSAHWISMLRDTDRTTPSEGAHILHRLRNHVKGGSDDVTFRMSCQSLPVHEHDRCARSVTLVQNVMGRHSEATREL